MLYRLTEFNTLQKKAEGVILIESTNITYMRPNDYNGTTITTNSGIVVVQESIDRILGKVHYTDIVERDL